MDNITHTLVGITVGELWYQAGRTEKKGKPSWVCGLKHSTVIATSVISNNFPDLDFLYAYGSDPHLGYLLHHRGHTHTMLFALAFTFLPWLILKLFPASRGKSGGRLLEILLLSGIGLWLHILLDSLNSYGVHPFWPLDNHWYYGDTLFILEPLAWVALIPAIIFSARQRFFRLTFAVFFFGIVALVWGVPFVRWYSALLVTTLGLGVWYLCQHQSKSRMSAISLAAFAGVVVIFFGTSRYIKQNYRAKFAVEHTDRAIADIILSPLPSNIFCWLFISVETGTGGNNYFLKRGIVAPFPLLVSADQCPLYRTERGRAPLVDIKERDRAGYQWTGEFMGDRAALRALDESHCQIRGFLKFARAPFVVSASENWEVGDLRYDSLSRMSFSSFLFPKRTTPCSTIDVPWIAPSHSW